MQGVLSAIQHTYSEAREEAQVPRNDFFSYSVNENILLKASILP